METVKELEVKLKNAVSILFPGKEEIYLSNLNFLRRALLYTYKVEIKAYNEPNFRGYCTAIIGGRSAIVEYSGHKSWRLSMLTLYLWVVNVILTGNVESANTVHFKIKGEVYFRTYELDTAIRVLSKHFDVSITQTKSKWFVDTAAKYKDKEYVSTRINPCNLNSELKLALSWILHVLYKEKLIVRWSNN